MFIDRGWVNCESCCKSTSWSGREAGKDDWRSRLTQRSCCSRTFTCISLQFKTVLILSSQVNDRTKCNFSPLTLLFGAARTCLVWWDTGVGKGCAVEGEGEGEGEPGPWTTAAAPLTCPGHLASGPGGAGCKPVISHGFCVVFHLWSWFQRALLKL